MATRTTKSEIQKLAAFAGLIVETWSPGDGTTRYRLFANKKAQDTESPMFTAMGAYEATVFIRGFLAGKGPR